jgi:hypothetical protein
MDGPEKSDPAVVAAKLAHKAERSVAEPAEPRAGTKGNADQQSTRRAQNLVSVLQALNRERKVQGKGRRRSSRRLLHHVDIAMLETAFYALKRCCGARRSAWRFRATFDAGSFLTG